MYPSLVGHNPSTAVAIHTIVTTRCFPQHTVNRPGGGNGAAIAAIASSAVEGNDAEGPATWRRNRRHWGNNTGPYVSIKSWNAGVPCAAATKLADESHAIPRQAITKSTAVHAGPVGPGFRDVVRN